MSFPKLTQKQIIRSLLSLLSSIAIIGLIAISVNLYKDTSAEERNNTQNITYDVCFTPNPDCLSLIIRQIEKAKKSIRVQAYSFTDPLIGESLVKAKQRGIDIKIILDKSNRTNKHSQIFHMKKEKIPVFIDRCSGVAHNKIIIIDNKTVITGSYNFSRNAYSRNAENVLVIFNVEIAKNYTKNWEKRLEISQQE